MSDSVHQPVMPNEVLAYLQPKEGGMYLDGTTGAGGHSRLILETANGKATLLGLDRDAEILAIAKENLKEFSGVTLVHASYAQALEAAKEQGFEGFDGILLDLGASSLQFDRPERGFSFKEDGPLDMRFDVSGGLQTAADIVNTYPQKELARIFREYGEEKHASLIAKAIVTDRKIAPFHSTRQLADLISRIMPRKHTLRIHPATCVFQALRIEVNQELETIKSALPELIGLLKQGGRIVVISFHSLEDRLVKQAFREAEIDCVCPPDFPVCRCDKQSMIKVLTKKPVLPTKKEIKNNLRSRSAKLRAAERK